MGEAAEWAVISLGKDGLWFGSEDRNGLKLGKKEIWVEELSRNVAVGNSKEGPPPAESAFHTALGGFVPPDPSLASLYLPSPCFRFLLFLFLGDM